MRNKYSPVILQTLGGSPQRDFEYEKKQQDFIEVKDRMVTLKKAIDNFPLKLQGFKQVLDSISGTCEFIFDKNQKECYQFMHNISSAHRALSEKLSLLFTQFAQIKNNTAIWVKELNDVINKIKLREQCLKKYYHYEKKLFQLNEDRILEIRKKNKISESDHERFIRNIGKFQKSGKDLIFASNSAFRAIEQFMNNRYDKVVMAMVNIVEAERGFYNEANHILNFFNNIRNNAFNIKKNYVTTNTKYDASLYIKGRAILNMSVEEIFSTNYKAPPPPQQGNNFNNFNNTGNNDNNNNNNSRGIVNPFTADSNNNNNDFGNNNNNNMGGNNFGNNNNQTGFGGQSTRETYAMSNPYNSQANSFPGNNNNYNNNYGKTNTFNNNSFVPKDGYNPFSSNNTGGNPYGGNNNNFNNNNQDDPWGINNKNNNQNNKNNQAQNNNNNNNNNNNINNNEDDGPFNF